jgi:hypothetical protein
MARIRQAEADLAGASMKARPSPPFCERPGNRGSPGELDLLSRTRNRQP